MINNVLNKLFSKNRTDSHTIYNILGIKIKTKYFYEKETLKLIHKNYKNVIKNISSKDKIRILFLVNENKKWKCQSLYNELSADKNYEVSIVLTIADFDVYCDKEHRLNKLKENENYFRKKGISVLYGWDTEKDCSLDLKNFKPDICFYQVPYNISPNQDIDYVSNYALCCYIPYYINQSENFHFMNTQYWHKKLYRFYVLNPYWKKITEKNLEYKLPGKNIVPASHPFLDYYLENKNSSSKYVIYAAHWSIDREDGLSTFLETGYAMLNYAKLHKEFNWVFTCHPTLLFNLVDKGYMSQECVEAYLNEWREFAIIQNDGDYLEYFNNAKLLISDAGSFRVEYFPTGKPYIYLINQNKKRLKDGKFLQSITKHYYKAYNVRELKTHLDNILIKDIDPFKKDRMKEKGNFITSCSGSELIHKDIIKSLKGIKTK